MKIESGTTSSDTLIGKNGDDFLRGNSGDDTVVGGYHDDSLEGGSGDDRLSGGYHDDSLDGGSGDDRLSGGYHDDSLEGGSGDDFLEGGSHDDLLEGGSGNDSLDGGIGQDTLIGGDGADSFIFTSLDSLDIIVDFDSGQGDKIIFDTINSGVSSIEDIRVHIGASYNHAHDHTHDLERVTSLYFEGERIIEFNSLVSLQIEDFEFI